MQWLGPQWTIITTTAALLPFHAETRVSLPWPRTATSKRLLRLVNNNELIIYAITKFFVIDRSTRWDLLQHYRRLRHIGDGRRFWHGLHFNQQLRRADFGIVPELSRSSTSTNERTHGDDSFDYSCIDPTNDTFANSRSWSETTTERPSSSFRNKQIPVRICSFEVESTQQEDRPALTSPLTAAFHLRCYYKQLSLYNLICM